MLLSIKSRGLLPHNFVKYDFVFLFNVFGDVLEVLFSSATTGMPEKLLGL